MTKTAWFLAPLLLGLLLVSSASWGAPEETAKKEITFEPEMRGNEFSLPLFERLVTLAPSQR